MKNEPSVWSFHYLKCKSATASQRRLCTWPWFTYSLTSLSLFNRFLSWLLHSLLFFPIESESYLMAIYYHRIAVHTLRFVVSIQLNLYLKTPDMGCNYLFALQTGGLLFVKHQCMRLRTKYCEQSLNRLIFAFHSVLCQSVMKSQPLSCINMIWF